MGKKSKKKKKKKIWNTHAQHTMRRRGLENENIYRGGVDNSVYHNHVNSRPSADFIPPPAQPINRLGEGIDVDKLAELRMREASPGPGPQGLYGTHGGIVSTFYTLALCS